MQVFEYTPFESIIPLFLILGIIISIFSIVVSGKKLNAISKEFAGHTFSYLDKQQLKILLEERGKKLNLGILSMVVSSFMAIISLATITTISYRFEFFGVSIFFLLIGVGMYILLRTSQRKNHVKKVLDKSIQ